MESPGPDGGEALREGDLLQGYAGAEGVFPERLHALGNSDSPEGFISEKRVLPDGRDGITADGFRDIQPGIFAGVVQDFDGIVLQEGIAEAAAPERDLPLIRLRLILLRENGGGQQAEDQQDRYRSQGDELFQHNRFLHKDRLHSDRHCLPCQTEEEQNRSYSIICKTHRRSKTPGPQGPGERITGQTKLTFRRG